MLSRAEQLILKRRTLQLRCALQRQEVSNLSSSIESRLSGADRFVEIVTGAVKNPLLLVGLFAGTMAIGPFRILRWASRGAMLFSVARGAMKLFRK